jgi:hypothetical protein
MKAVFARDTAVVSSPEGSQQLVRFGEHWPADDPVVLANPALFSDDPRYGMTSSRPLPMDEGPVEQVTAGPGEKRATRRSG